LDVHIYCLKYLFFAIIGAVLVYKCKKFCYNRATHQALDGNRFFSNAGREDDERDRLISNKNYPDLQEQQPQAQPVAEQQLLAPQQHEAQVLQSGWNDVELGNNIEDDLSLDSIGAAVEAAAAVNVDTKSVEEKKRTSLSTNEST
jgi:hypothetical protein